MEGGIRAELEKLRHPRVPCGRYGGFENESGVDNKCFDSGGGEALYGEGSGEGK